MIETIQPLIDKHQEKKRTIGVKLTVREIDQLKQKFNVHSDSELLRLALQNDKTTPCQSQDDEGFFGRQKKISVLNNQVNALTEVNVKLTNEVQRLTLVNQELTEVNQRGLRDRESLIKRNRQYSQELVELRASNVKSIQNAVSNELRCLHKKLIGLRKRNSAHIVWEYYLKIKHGTLPKDQNQIVSECGKANQVPNIQKDKIKI